MATKTLHIEGFPGNVLKALKAVAALQGVTVKTLVIDSLRKEIEAVEVSKWVCGYCLEDFEDRDSEKITCEKCGKGIPVKVNPIKKLTKGDGA